MTRGDQRYCVLDSPQAFAAGLAGWAGFTCPDERTLALTAELARGNA